MQYHFDSDIAILFSVEEAIIIENIRYWIMKNQANDKHFYDGRYWTYNSVKAFSELFPFWSESQINRILKKLKDNGAILVGNYNKAAYDRTQWYSLSDDIYPMLHKGKIHFAESSNGNDEIVKPIPVNKPVNKTNNMCIDSLFEKLWQKYPLKKGKANVSKTQKQKLFKLGEEVMVKCISRYLKEMEGKEDYLKHGSTFFNSGYIDYLDENYQEIKKKPKESDGYNAKPFEF